MEINFCNKHDLQYHGSWYDSKNKMMVIVLILEPSILIWSNKESNYCARMINFLS